MALTVTKNDIQEFTTLVGQLTIDSYATNGQAVAASDFGFLYLKELLVGNSEGGYVFAYDPSAGTIKAFVAGTAGSPLNEVANATDLSGEPFSYVAVGVGEVDSDDF